MKVNRNCREVCTFIGFLIISISFSTCKKREENKNNDTPQSEVSFIKNLPDNSAGKQVKKSIENAGGWENWQKKKTLSYHKTIQYYDSAGNQIREVKQLHQYRLKPTFQARISWEDDGHEYVITNNGMEAAKFIDGERSMEQGDIDHAWNSSFGSHYVIGMPFKLADPGTVLEHQGMEILPDGDSVSVIKVDYEPGAGSSAGMHQWYYYFNPQNGALVANFLDYGDGYSYTEYADFEVVDNIKFSKRRISYSANANKKKEPGKTIYVNDEIKFNEELPEDLFTFD